MIQKIQHRKTVKNITAEKTKIRAAAYCRVSTAQELQEDSFDLQMETTGIWVGAAHRSRGETNSSA